MNEATIVLQDAKEYLFEKGWHQGDYGTQGGPVCLVGACLMVRFDCFNPPLLPVGGLMTSL